MRFIVRLSTTRPKWRPLSTFVGCACASMVESGIVGSTAETQGSGKACRTPLSQPISPTACCSRTFIGAFRGPFYHQSDRKGRSWHNSKLSSPSPDMWAPIPRNSTRMACPMPARSEWRAPDGISTIAHSNGKIFLPRGSR